MPTAHPTTATTGWIVELAGAAVDSPLFLSISPTDARFGWTQYFERALMLAREKDAQALGRYAGSRIKEGATAVMRSVLARISHQGG